MLYLQLGLTGAITGSLYALLALGIVLVFRTVKVLNLAHGAIATLCVYLFLELRTREVLGYWPALGAVVAAGALAGVAIDRAIMARIASRSLLAKIIATLGILIVLQTIVGLAWGFDVRTVPTSLPQGSVRIGALYITYEQIIVALLAAGLGGALWWLLRATYLGLAMRALAESPETTQLLGVDAARVSTITWAVGSGLAAAAGVLLAPSISVEPVTLTAILPKAFAAALVGRLVSLPGAFLGGILLGMLESYVPLFFTVSGAPDAVAFFVIVALLAVRSPFLSERDLEVGIA